MGKFSTYENLQSSIAFKNFLVKNIDSDYLLSSFIAGNDDEAVLLNGLDRFKQETPESISERLLHNDNFESCVSSGMNVSVILVGLCASMLS